MANNGENKKPFVLALSDFYKLFLGNTAQAILKLAEIQEKFGSDYNALKELQLDPSKLEKYLENLTDEQKGYLLGLFTKAASFERRIMLLFESTASEKRQLAKDIETFSKNIEDKMKQISEEK